MGTTLMAGEWSPLGMVPKRASAHGSLDDLPVFEAAAMTPVRVTTKTAMPKVQVVIFTASWCGPCQVQAKEWPTMLQHGWQRGVHFVEKDPESPEYFVAGRPAMPCLLRYEGGKEVARMTGPLTAWQMAEFYYGRLK